MPLLILDNGEKVYELTLDAKTYTAYKNTDSPNHFNVVRYCFLTDTTTVIALPKRFLMELVEAITKKQQ